MLIAETNGRRSRTRNVLFAASIWDRVHSPGARRLAGSVLISLGGQALVLLGMFLATRQSARDFGAIGFGVYQVARRTLNVVVFPLMCGTGISIPRYLACSEGRRSEGGPWLLAGASLAGGLQLAFLVLAAFFAASLGRFTFGTASTPPLFISLLVAITGLSIHNLGFSALRGLSRFPSAAALQVVNISLVPLAGILMASGQASNALLITGVLWIAIGGSVFVRVCQQSARPFPKARDFRNSFRKLAVFGVPRTPGEVALFGLFALPVYYAAGARSDVVRAGVLSFGMSLVQLVASAFTAAGVVLLPYWSRASLRIPLDQSGKSIKPLLICSLLFAAAACGLLQLWLRPISNVLLGSFADERIPELRWVLIGMIPFAIYLVLRDYLDAVSVFPITTVALSTAFFSEFAVLQLTRLPIGVAIACGFSSLGLATLALWVGLLKMSSMKNRTQADVSSIVCHEPSGA